MNCRNTPKNVFYVILYNIIYVILEIPNRDKVRDGELVIIPFSLSLSLSLLSIFEMLKCTKIIQIFH